MVKKYIVSLGYYDYRFEDRNTALDFAEMAFDAQEENKSVSVKFVKEEEQEEEGDDNE